MKRFLLSLLIIIPCTALASQTKRLIKNPDTGKLDWITIVDSTTLLDAGVFGEVIVKHADGTQTSYSTTTDNPITRGDMLIEAWGVRRSSDVFYLSPTDFNVVHSTIDMHVYPTGSISIIGAGKDKTLVQGTDGRVLFSPGQNSLLADLTAKCVSAQDFCLPIGTEELGSTATIRNVRAMGGRDVIYVDNSTPVYWDIINTDLECGWDCFIQTNATYGNIPATFNVFGGRTNGVANPANDDSPPGGTSHGALAFNTKGTINFHDHTITIQHGSVENIGVDVSGGHVNFYGSSVTALGHGALQVRNDDTGGTFKYDLGSAVISTQCSFDNQTSPRSFESVPAPFRMGGLQGIMTLDPITGCWRVGDDDSLADNSYFQWCTNDGSMIVNISGDQPFSIQGANLHSTRGVFFDQLFLPESNTTSIAQSLNIKDGGDSFNSAQTALLWSSSIYTSERINGDGSYIRNAAGGSATNGTGPKRNVNAVQISTSGTNPTTSVPGQSWVLGGTLYSFFNSTGNTGTTETTLYSNTISSNTMLKSSDSITFAYFGTALNSATATSQFKLKHGTTTILDTGAMAMSAAGSWTIQGTIISNSTTTVISHVDFEGTGFALSVSDSVLDVGGLNRTGSQTLALTATRAGVGAATNDILGRSGKIQVWPTP